MPHHLLRCSRPGAALAAALAAPLFAQEPLRWPATPAGEIARAWFAAVAADTDAAALAFEARWRSAAKLEERSAAEGARRLREMTAQVGALHAERVLRHDAAALAVLARSDRVPMPLCVTFELTATSPPRLQTLSIRPHAGRQLRAADYAGFEDLADLLTRVVGDTGLPALAAAIVVGDRIVDAAAVGVRAIDAAAEVEAADRFHVGSIAKSMTATVVGALVEQGALRWDLTLAEALPGVAMRERYRAVTLAQLLRHRAGLPMCLTMDDAVERDLLAKGDDARSRRAAFVAAVLAAAGDEPFGPPGAVGAFAYSNAGYAIAGHIAERAADAPWEELVRRHVFAPFGMQTARVGWPATAAEPAQPRGHFDDGDDLRPQGLDEYPLGPLMAPAGDVACSVEDLARYAMAHLQGLRGEDGALRAATIAALHDPGPDAGSRYAAGWSVAAVDGRVVHGHNGSAGTFFAQVELVPASDCAVVVMANAGMSAGPVVEALVGLLRERAVAPR